MSLSNFLIMPAAAALNVNCSNLTLRMKHPSKLTLSAEELQLVTDAGWILTKHTITGKVYAMFGKLAEQYRLVMEQLLLPLDVTGPSPKISRGENYRQLPYVILDYPRCFEQENIVAIRTLFWWGNFFSITLHLSGAHKQKYEAELFSAFESLKEDGYHLCIHTDPWQHHFEEDNYRPVNTFSREAFEECIRQKPFVKLAVKFPLSGWNEIPSVLERNFCTMVGLLQP